MVEEEKKTIELGADASVQERFNRTINNMTIARREGDLKTYIEEMIACFKEIYVELNSEEKKGFSFLTNARNKVFALPTNPENITGTFLAPGKVLFELDELELEVRELSKIHGFLSANKPPREGLITDM